MRKWVRRVPATPLEPSRSLAAVFTPVRQSGLVDEISDRIEAAVETGLLSTGQRLPNEAELAAALGVSAVTVREALSRLRARDIVVTTRGRNGGSFIAETSRGTSIGTARLRDMTRVQLADLGLHYQAIAGTCAIVAARRASPRDIDTLRTFVRADGDDPRQWRLIESEFVLEIAAIARTARLARELLHLQAELGPLTLLPQGDAEYRSETVALREAVAAAIETRNSAAAEDRTQQLIAAGTHWLIAEQARLDEGAP